MVFIDRNMFSMATCRSRRHPEGKPGLKLTRKQKRELYVANLIVKNTVDMALELLASGVMISIENPSTSLPLVIKCLLLGLKNHCPVKLRGS